MKNHLILETKNMEKGQGPTLFFTIDTRLTSFVTSLKVDVIVVESILSCIHYLTYLRYIVEGLT